MDRLPTDNLYKFMTVFGLVVVLNFGYYIYKYFNAVDSHTFEAEMLVKKKIDVDSPEFNEKFKLLKQMKDQAVDQIEKERIQEIINDLKQGYRERNFSIDKILRIIDHETKESFSVYIFKYCVVPVFVFGVVVAACGFRMWYVKVQQHQDILFALMSEPSKKGKKRIKKSFCFKKSSNNKSIC